MPTRQTTTTSPMPQPASSSSEDNGHLNLVLENNYGRMRMPSGALRDVDELVNEIKLNLRLKGSAGSSSGGGAGVCGGGSLDGGSDENAVSTGGKSKAKSCRGLARIHSAPYHLHQCSEQEKKEGFHSREAWQKRHHLGPSTTDNSSVDDPYVLLQELLQEGGLIKEAVRRINYVQGEHSHSPVEQAKCFDYEKDEYEKSSQLITFLPTL